VLADAGSIPAGSTTNTKGHPQGWPFLLALRQRDRIRVRHGRGASPGLREAPPRAGRAGLACKPNRGRFPPAPPPIQKVTRKGGLFIGIAQRKSNPRPARTRGKSGVAWSTASRRASRFGLQAKPREIPAL